MSPSHFGQSARRQPPPEKGSWLRWVGILWGLTMGGLVTLADGDDRIGGLWLVAGVAISFCGRPVLLVCINIMEPGAYRLIHWLQSLGERPFAPSSSSARRGGTSSLERTSFRSLLFWLPGLWSQILGFLAGGLAGAVCFLVDPEGLRSGSQAALLGIAAGLLLTPWIVGLSLALFLPLLERLAKGPQPTGAERIALLFTPLLLPVVSLLGLLHVVRGERNGR